LFAPTVPSEPRPKKIARTVSGGFDVEGLVVGEARPRDVVVDADREPAPAAPRASSSKMPATMPGVNSFEERP
jgi:hypothetical protein